MASEVTPKDKLLHAMGVTGGVFHLSDGLHFARMTEGRVLILLDGETPSHWTVDASSWASVVASVSARGDNYETHPEALEAHNRIG